jgi:ribA/ribD-fused uncharacterized protein
VQQLGIESVEAAFEPVFFYAGDNEFNCFSNFYRCNIMVDGKTWPTTEHYFQAMKINSEPDQEAIRLAASPGLAKGLARKLVIDREQWDKVKFEVMLKCLRIKFAQPGLKEILLKTGERPIYEDSPSDKIWGTGTLKGSGPGRNLLGIALMQVRSEIKSS